MFRVHAGTTRKYCDGLTRRSFVQLGIAGLASVGLPRILAAKEASQQFGRPQRDTAVIMLWLDGGPSHLDMYDMKPEAPAEYRGLWNPIRTSVPGIEISELFPRQAKVADKFSLIRSLHHDNGDHFTGAHYLLTSRDGASGGDTTGKYPSIASIATKLRGPRREGMPAYAAVPYAASVGLRPGYFGANYLGHAYNPFETNGDPNDPNFKVDNIQLSDALTIDRLEDRRALLSHFDRLRRDMDSSGAMETMDRFDHKAYEMVAGGAARQAFDIGVEDEATREMYGRHPWGQSTLLARRLVEAGSTWVTVHMGGWDHHWDLKAGYERNLPIVDALVSALFTDLDQRGLLDQTLVILCGEFSRTPRMNDGGNGGPAGSMGTPGRDHWGNAMSVLIGGGGIHGGRVVGATNSRGEVPQDRPVEACDLHATIYRCLGIDPSVSFLNHAGRPVPAIDRGEVITELL
ncbi:MAG: DUF1501 domain-containing protein [Planctomycetota bacterium]|nr:MAG: DUF1501 domain-containing protein [Planctomycetota bacterium]